jgi:hypothetical protein
MGFREAFEAPRGAFTVCANGPLQRSRLMPLTARNGGSWHDLAEGAFKHAGTRVKTALLVINA